MSWLDAHGRGHDSDEIDEDHLAEPVDIKSDEGVANATVNRYLIFIRPLLRRAWRNWKWLDQMSVIELLC